MSFKPGDLVTIDSNMVYGRASGFGFTALTLLPDLAGSNGNRITGTVEPGQVGLVIALARVGPTRRLETLVLFGQQLGWNVAACFKPAAIATPGSTASA